MIKHSIFAIAFALFMQDAVFARSTLLDNDDDTVTDVTTGLMWQQIPLAASTYNQAIVYCADLILGGHANWRMPEVKELLSIIDYKFYDPALDPIAFPNTADNQLGSFWGHSTDTATTKIRVVKTELGTVTGVLVSPSFSTVKCRCVRSLN